MVPASLHFTVVKHYAMLQMFSYFSWSHNLENCARPSVSHRPPAPFTPPALQSRTDLLLPLPHPPFSLPQTSCSLYPARPSVSHRPPAPFTPPALQSRTDLLLPLPRPPFSLPQTSCSLYPTRPSVSHRPPAPFTPPALQSPTDLLLPLPLAPPQLGAGTSWSVYSWLRGKQWEAKCNSGKVKLKTV